MARQEQSDMGGIPRDGQPGAPGPNGQPFPDTSPQAMRSGTSPNPAEQMKRGTPQMNSGGIPSPVPDGGQSRESPNAMNFLGNHVDVSMAPHFYKGVDGGNMGQAQMNGMRPPSSHPGQPFNGPMNAQQMMAARQQQQQNAQGNPQQWQPGMNGQMVPQGMQQGQQVQGTPQQRSMPPPSAPAAAAANTNNRTTASPQQASAAPPTPSQTNKAAPKKKDTKNAKDKVSSAPNIPILQSDGSYSEPLHRRRQIRTPTTPLLPPPRTMRKLTRQHQLPPSLLLSAEPLRTLKPEAPCQTQLPPPRLQESPPRLPPPVRRCHRKLPLYHNPLMTFRITVWAVWTTLLSQ